MATKEFPEAFWDNAEREVRDWETLKRLPEYTGLCLFMASGGTAVPLICHTFLNSEKQRCWQPVHQGPTLDQKQIDAFMKKLEQKQIDACIDRASSPCEVNDGAITAGQHQGQD